MEKMLLAFIGLISLTANALELKDGKARLNNMDEYSQCQNRDYGGDLCDAALKEWVSAHPSDSFKAGQLTRLHMNAWGAIYFFDKSFASKSGDCNDSDVWLAVESAADLPSESYKEVLAQTKKIALKICFKEMKERLIKLVDGGGYPKRNFCRDLVSLKVYNKSCD